MSSRRSLRRYALPLIGGLVALGLVACAPATSKITLSHAIVPVPATADTASVYLRITNDGDLDDRLLDVTTAKAAMTNLHKTTIDADGRATMRGVGTVKIPAGKTVELSPGGLHLMMMQPEVLTAGQTVDFTLTFEHAGEKTITAKVSDDIADVVGE